MPKNTIIELKDMNEKNKLLGDVPDTLPNENQVKSRKYIFNSKKINNCTGNSMIVAMFLMAFAMLFYVIGNGIYLVYNSDTVKSHSVAMQETTTEVSGMSYNSTIIGNNSIYQNTTDGSNYNTTAATSISEFSDTDQRNYSSLIFPETTTPLQDTINSTTIASNLTTKINNSSQEGFSYSTNVGYDEPLQTNNSVINDDNSTTTSKSIPLSNDIQTKVLEKSEQSKKVNNDINIELPERTMSNVSLDTIIDLKKAQNSDKNKVLLDTTMGPDDASFDPTPTIESAKKQVLQDEKPKEDTTMGPDGVTSGPMPTIKSAKKQVLQDEKPKEGIIINPDDSNDEFYEEMTDLPHFNDYDLCTDNSCTTFDSYEQVSAEVNEDSASNTPSTSLDEEGGLKRERRQVLFKKKEIKSFDHDNLNPYRGYF